MECLVHAIEKLIGHRHIDTSDIGKKNRTGPSRERPRASPWGNTDRLSLLPRVRRALQQVLGAQLTADYEGNMVAWTRSVLKLRRAHWLDGRFGVGVGEKHFLEARGRAKKSTRFTTCVRRKRGTE